MPRVAKTRLYLVRHGETDWNVEHRLQGTVDVRLNSVGVEARRR
jgi:broad specificity phosphatase PhoE